MALGARPDAGTVSAARTPKGHARRLMALAGLSAVAVATATSGRRRSPSVRSTTRGHPSSTRHRMHIASSSRMSSRRPASGGTTSRPDTAWPFPSVWSAAARTGCTSSGCGRSAPCHSARGRTCSWHPVTASLSRGDIRGPMVSADRSPRSPSWQAGSTRAGCLGWSSSPLPRFAPRSTCRRPMPSRPVQPRVRAFRSARSAPCWRASWVACASFDGSSSEGVPPARREPHSGGRAG